MIAFQCGDTISRFSTRCCAPHLVSEHALDARAQPNTVRHKIPHDVGSLPPIASGDILLNLMRTLEVHGDVLPAHVHAAGMIGKKGVPKPHLHGIIKTRLKGSTSPLKGSTSPLQGSTSPLKGSTRSLM